MSERIGVYICECGPNIGDAIHIDQVISAIEPMANVATVKRHKLLCSGDGQNFLVDEIKNENLTHLVVAACSPKDHEITFMKVSVRGGINPYLSQVVNIREHCAWIFEDKEIATQKAIKYIKAGIERVRLHKPLLKKELDMNPDVVVVGGGIAGIESALSLAGPERKIYLIEKESELGGKVLKYRDIMKHSGFNLEMIDKKIEALNNNSQIEILTNTSVDRV
ncbi:FAD-dependent oxidoreductase, partial [bacterium]|nr:FAD-dependent oxidoreductase [bacterium]